MEKIYKTIGVCSKNIVIEIEDDIIKSVDFQGGCDGNLQGISTLVAGMKIKDVIEKLRGINCNGRGTSCPDQLAKALEEVK